MQPSEKFFATIKEESVDGNYDGMPALLEKEAIKHRNQNDG